MSSERAQEPGEVSQAAPSEGSQGAPSQSLPPKKKKKKLRPAPPPPLTEEQINSPTNQTLGMLGVVCIMSLCMWVFARGGCNYHPPKESRDPRKVELVDLARDPKDAALEFELRWSTLRWGGAAELAKGPMIEAVKERQQACDRDPGCAKKASDLRSTVLGSAELLERDAMHAVARVTIIGAGPKPLKHIIRVERDQSIWKTIAREVDDGSFQPRPASLPDRDGALLLRQPGMPAPAPPPSASAAPSGQ
jgi:hypothetical protein